MRVVAALGGNALSRWRESPDPEALRRNVAAAAQVLAELAALGTLVVTHGNGPQVGWLAQQSWTASAGHPDPLDVLDAESEGLIGYVLERELRNALPARECATLLTQVVVDADDPAFLRPTKPIGPPYAPADAERLAAQLGWQFTRGEAERRRVVPSPRPHALVEAKAIEMLVEADVIVICAGGGGIPVVVNRGRLRGVEAVIDKDRTAALLARVVQAEVLALLTDVDGVYFDWGTTDARLVRRAHPDHLRAVDLDAGSIGPKVEAAIEFASTGGVAVIGRVEDAAAMLRGAAGTTITTAASTLELA